MIFLVNRFCEAINLVPTLYQLKLHVNPRSHEVYSICVLYFYEQSNRLRKIEGLDALVNLEEFYASNNGIQKVEGLENNVS